MNLVVFVAVAFEDCALACRTAPGRLYYYWSIPRPYAHGWWLRVTV